MDSSRVIKANHDKIRLSMVLLDRTSKNEN